MSVRSPAVALPGSPLDRIIHLVEFKSVFLATVCCAILLILGNPPPLFLILFLNLPFPH